MNLDFAVNRVTKQAFKDEFPDMTWENAPKELKDAFKASVGYTVKAISDLGIPIAELVAGRMIAVPKLEPITIEGETVQ